MGKFKNIDDVPNERGVGNLLRWKLHLGPEASPSTPARADVPFVENDGKALQGASERTLTWVGHATYLIQLAGLSVLTDPVLSPRIAVIPRNVPPGLTYETLPKIDVVTVSHNHRDHMDAATLERLGSRPIYVVPKGLAGWFTSKGYDVRELDWWQSTTIENLTVTFVPSQHWSRRGLFDEDATLWGGFVFQDAEKRVYHSGDTAYFSGFRAIGERCGPIDAALLPIGAYEPRWFMKAQHMNPEDAAQAFEDLGAKEFFAMHWGTFKLTDEDLLEPPTRIRAAFAARGLDPARLHVPAIGETVRLT